jgi:hypothetical protein
MVLVHGLLSGTKNLISVTTNTTFATFATFALSL